MSPYSDNDADRTLPDAEAELAEESPTVPPDAHPVQPDAKPPAQTLALTPEIPAEPFKTSIDPDKEPPVLDVDLPYPTHTWKDFFIHIATISVGLLIALGLEQSVEALHHVHERHVLMNDFHAECRGNLKLIAVDIASLRSARDWDITAVKTLNNAPVINGYVTVVFPKPENHPWAGTPSRAVWSVAKASGKVALLPENLAEVYDRVDFEGEEFYLANNQTNINKAALTRFNMSFGASTIMSGATLHLTIAQRDQLIDTLATLRSDLDNMCNWLASWQGASQAVIDGVVDREAMDGYIQRAHDALHMDLQ
jgi:hypothetical protein